MSERIVVVCPGRGSYGERELGSLKRLQLPEQKQQKYDAAVARFDQQRAAQGELTVREMDGSERFSARFLKGENAAPLIYACTMADFLRIDPAKAEVVAVVGNSMGWYSALLCAGVFDLDAGFELITTMGSSQKDKTIGGQLIYPLVHNDNWQNNPAQHQAVLDCCTAANNHGHQLGLSINLGGFAVLWGDEGGIEFALKQLPVVKFGGRDYPFRLMEHAAFHSPLLHEASSMGLTTLAGLPWKAPSLPLIDGRGGQWRPLTTDPAALLDYTLREQVLTTFDFTAAIRCAVREYAPDRIVLLGPGESLGGAVAQVLIAQERKGLRSKQDFFQLQQKDPFVLSMVRPEQASLVI